MKNVNNNASVTLNEHNIERKFEFSAFYRWHHWIRVFSIVILTITGFYIAEPFISPVPNSEPTNFTYAILRSWHEIFGFVMISMFIGKTYYFFFVKTNRHEMHSIKDIFSVKNWLDQIGYYLFLTKHPKLSGMYNVIQFMAYIGFYLMSIGLIITGLILYVHVYHNGLGGMLYSTMRYFEVMLGGLANVRELHHLLMWGIIFFVVAHIYMAVFNAVHGKEGTLDSIFSGYKWYKKH
jgi:Ni/Fe-hydrogenase 1 B-type cytochrome subunit